MRHFFIKSSIFLKKDIFFFYFFFIQERFNKLIYSKMWHLTACKISVSISVLNWIKMATLIQKYSKKSFHFKNERLTEILQAVRCHIL